MMTHKRIQVFMSAVLCLALLAAGCSKPAATGAATGTKMELAVKYLAEAQYDKAVLAYQEVIKIDSKLSLAYIGLSTAMAMQNKTEDSIKALADGLKVIPGDASLQLALAGAYAAQGDKDNTESTYKKSIIETAANITAYQAYSSWLINADRAADAVALLEKAVQENTSLYGLQSLLALAYQADGKNAEAMAAAASSIEKQPAQAESYRCLEALHGSNPTRLLAAGEQYLQQGRDVLGSALKLNALYKLNRFNEGVQFYQSLSPVLQGQPYIRLLASRTYSKLGQTDQGKTVLNTLDFNSAMDAGLLADIAGFFLETGDSEKARLVAEQGVARDAAVLENYRILYQSCAKDDPIQAKIWAITYLLKSGLGFSQGIENLLKAGIVLREQDARSQALRTILWSAAVISRFQSAGPNINSGFFKYGCAYDPNKNKAYVGLLLAPMDADEWIINGRGFSSDLAWKSIVLVVNNPNLMSVQNVPSDYLNGQNMAKYRDYCNQYNVQQVVTLPFANHGFSGTRYHAISVITDNFGADLQKAGISSSNLIFLEI